MYTIEKFGGYYQNDEILGRNFEIGRLGQNCSHCDIFIQFKNHVMYYTFTTRVPNRLVPCGIYHSIHYQQA